MNSTKGLSLYYHYEIFCDDVKIDEDIYCSFGKCFAIVEQKQKQFVKARKQKHFYAVISCYSHNLCVKVYSCLFDEPLKLQRSAKVCYDVCDKTGKVITTVHSDVVARQLANSYDGYYRIYIQCLNSKKRFYYE